MKNKRPYDWFKFWVHFICGMVIGAFIGVRVLARSHYATSSSMLPPLAFIGLAALGTGLGAGLISHTGWDEQIR